LVDNIRPARPPGPRVGIPILPLLGTRQVTAAFIETLTLPAEAAETLQLVLLTSMDHAKAAEKAIHLVLDDRRIREANNRELFHLAAPQLAAVCEVLVQLGDEVME